MTATTAHEARLLRVARYFALGDALGAPFEYQEPYADEIEERWESKAAIEFTDDTYLLLSTRDAMRETGWRNGGSATPELRDRTLERLLAWFESGDHRGIGRTTRAALRQLSSHFEEGRPMSEFTIQEKNYRAEWSAGNGALSRALPLVVAGASLDEKLAEWIRLTHLHADARAAVWGLADFLRDENRPARQESWGGEGTYAPETLWMAIDSIDGARSLKEVWHRSIRPRADNDSIAALAFGLWGALRPEEDPELPRLWQRMAVEDRRCVEDLATL